MRRVLASVTVAIVAAGLAPQATRAASLGPAAPAASTPAQGLSRPAIHRAVARATHSRYLWATVNICLPKPHSGGVIGVRGEMPALGFASALSMTIQLNQYLPTQKRFAAVPGATARRTVTIGGRTRGVHQDGAEFPYASNTGTLNATVTFTWTRGGRRLGRATRTTTGGHPSAAFGQPPHSSTGRCRL